MKRFCLSKGIKIAKRTYLYAFFYSRGSCPLRKTHPCIPLLFSVVMISMKRKSEKELRAFLFKNIFLGFFEDIFECQLGSEREYSPHF